MITFNLSRTVSIVTGAASGIGLATAEALARAGGTVFLNDLPGSAALDAAVASLAAEGLDVHPCPADQSHPDAVSLAVDGVKALGGRLDYLVNNAATPGKSAQISPDNFDRMDEAFWQRLVSVNQIAPVSLGQVSGPASAGDRRSDRQRRVHRRARARRIIICLCFDQGCSDCADQGMGVCIGPASPSQCDCPRCGCRVRLGLRLRSRGAGSNHCAPAAAPRWNASRLCPVHPVVSGRRALRHGPDTGCLTEVVFANP